MLIFIVYLRTMRLLSNEAFLFIIKNQIPYNETPTFLSNLLDDSVIKIFFLTFDFEQKHIFFNRTVVRCIDRILILDWKVCSIHRIHFNVLYFRRKNNINNNNELIGNGNRNFHEKQHIYIHTQLPYPYCLSRLFLLTHFHFVLFFGLNWRTVLLRMKSLMMQAFFAMFRADKNKRYEFSKGLVQTDYIWMKENWNFGCNHFSPHKVCEEKYWFYQPILTTTAHGTRKEAAQKCIKLNSVKLIS